MAASGVGRRLVVVLLRCLLTLLAASALSACNSANVVHDVNQSQANQIVALLNQHGIGAIANRETGGKGRFNVTVKNDNYAQAVSLLSDKGLPAEPELTFSELVAQQGLLPSSREIETLRLDHAMAAEIEDLLRNNPAVAAARVVVRLNSVKNDAPPAVSLVIQQRKNTDLNRDEITELVSRTVPGVSKDNIFVAMHPAPEEDVTDLSQGAYNDNGKVIRRPLVPFLMIWQVPEDQYTTLAFVLIICFVIVGAVGGIFGYWYAYSQAARHAPEGDFPEIRQRVLKVERIRKDLPEN